MNNLEKFTPGPWHPEVQEDDDGGGILTIRNDVAVEIGAICPQGDIRETEANARLIAAAKEMYEALQAMKSAMLNVLDNADLPGAILTAADEALEKTEVEARGKK